MKDKILMKGNEALAEAAIRGGCRYYFGYPITPQNEVPAYMSKRLPEVGGVFIQAESETASINMVYGACASGARAMTSSSSPGISLMQEGISYIAGSEVPAVIINVMRGGPGLGNISPSQADYLQSVKGGGHGDYNVIIFAPSTVQELADYAYDSFDVAFKYRNPVMILADGVLGQISEGVILPEFKEIKDAPEWALGKGKERNIIRSLFLNPEDRLTTHNIHLQEKYRRIEKEIQYFEEYKCEDAEYLIVAYGTTSRICKSAIDNMRNNGIKIGLFRPISLWPFPYAKLKENAASKETLFVVEMAYNQLEQDVRIGVEGAAPIERLNKLGGSVFNEEEIIDFISNSITLKGNKYVG
ncbi:MAG TPA: 3-methyl-2-oxobutanoate dehydrogenase subunit VorB [Spirochaetota bacterium]|jgi:2-oxoglutarate ferredoxin oxidoreductase subunit alpha|nr:MAG: 2-oxoglutarate oxidoreductase subunit KorA [Spirochaetes bacterium ADurb.Bin133]HNZ26173.1 3-methyl-2-oxobutanoate dehydrogenase subunit VorB [Spirochaetota bacterium]HPY86600.1 3-methyl-2-oxobutanoate dehydrogenase subunit VorB [Spirochaetota bacterium]HQB62293.1 3-methyl-2-oxobutanoate dehydrogenase subunit VorB [Spirochaetota bacterium]